MSGRTISIEQVSEHLNQRSSPLSLACSPTNTSIQNYWNIETITRAPISNPLLGLKYNVRATIRHLPSDALFTGIAEHDAFDVAKRCSISEAYERLVATTRSRESTSSGFASHTSLVLACQNSLCELVERDTIIESWINGRAPSYKLCLSPKSQLSSLLSRFGFQLSIYAFNPLWSKSDTRLHVMFAVISPKKQSLFWRTIHKNKFEGRICGFGCAFDKNTALFKAYREAAINAWALHIDQGQLSNSYNGTEWDNSSHRTFYLNNENTAAFSFLEKAVHTPEEELYDLAKPMIIEEQSSVLSRLHKFITENKAMIQWHVYALPDTHSPYYVVKATSPDLQELFFSRRPERLNQERIKADTLSEHAQQMPHPIS